jgi:hypothetical protein
VLTVGPTGLKVGSSSPLGLTIGNTGDAVAVDAYLGVVLPPVSGPGLGCPAGDAVAFAVAGSSSLVVRCASQSPATFPRFVAGASLPAALPSTTVSNFFGLAWPSTAPGSYSVFLILTTPNSVADGGVAASDVIAATTKTVTIAN